MFLVESKHQTPFLKNVSVWIMLKFSSLYKISCFINPKLLIAQYLHCKCKRGESCVHFLYSPYNVFVEAKIERAVVWQSLHISQQQMCKEQLPGSGQFVLAVLSKAGLSWGTDAKARKAVKAVSHLETLWRWMLCIPKRNHYFCFCEVAMSMCCTVCLFGRIPHALPQLL